MSELGTLLRIKRGDRSLREVADELGISASTLWRTEQGKLPTLEHGRIIEAWIGEKPNKTEIPRHVVATMKARIRAIEAELVELKRLVDEL